MSRVFSLAKCLSLRWPCQAVNSIRRPGVPSFVRSRVVHGLGWVGSGWVEIFSVFGGLGWVHYSKSTKKLERIMLMHG